uniref:DNA excision repair protein ERCC-1 n=1 Tax=Rhizophora mucronata TaxID=61149 RepID=A0A2P2L6C4_RHIMU
MNELCVWFYCLYSFLVSICHMLQLISQPFDAVCGIIYCILIIYISV